MAGIVAADRLRKALSLHHAGRLAEAEAVYRGILAIDPNHFDSLHLLGVLRAQQGDMEGSLELIRRALVLDGKSSLAHFHLAEGQRQLKRYDEALASYARAIALDPGFQPAEIARGGCLAEAGRPAEALAVLDRVTTESPELHNYRGVALLGLHRNEEALASFDCALALAPSHRDATEGRSNALIALDRLEEALAMLDRLVAEWQDSAEAHVNRAGILIELGRTEEGLAAYQQALARNPNCDFAYYNFGNALLALDRGKAALAAFDSALLIRPDYVEALYNRAWTLENLGRMDEALADCEKALAIDRNLGLAATKLFLGRARRCDWRGRDEQIAELRRLCEEDRLVDAFTLVCAVDEPGLHLKAARGMAGRQRAAWNGGPRGDRERLRIAYLSPDFHDHPVAHQAVELFERHDRARFSICGVCLAPGAEIPIRRRLRAAFDDFVEAGPRSDRDLAQLVRSLDVDIAVDLAGYTDRGRTKALAFRPAPIAVNYLGYPGTSGADYVDYLIADRVVVPPELEEFFTEKIVRLPGCYMPSDTRDRANPEPPSRSDMQLPEEGVVFCAFNSTFKITPQVFDVWMRLVAAVEASVLWLNVQDAAARDNLRREAQARGVGPGRLVFAEREAERTRHLARLGLADMFLDTPIYGAHSTATDMLWAGVPVITCLGRSFAARVAASELMAIGAEELIAPDLDAYEKLAIDLARSPGRLAAVRDKLSRNRATHSLFDTASLCRHLESAYRTMWDLYRRGRRPESFSVNIDA